LKTVVRNRRYSGKPSFCVARLHSANDCGHVTNGKFGRRSVAPILGAIYTAIDCPRCRLDAGLPFGLTHQFVSERSLVDSPHAPRARIVGGVTGYLPDLLSKCTVPRAHQHRAIDARQKVMRRIVAESGAAMLRVCTTQYNVAAKNFIQHTPVQDVSYERANLGIWCDRYDQSVQYVDLVGRFAYICASAAMQSLQVGRLEHVRVNKNEPAYSRTNENVNGRGTESAAPDYGDRCSL
jgi:hypothetical protein